QHRFQVGVAIEAESLHDRAVEVADEPVGQEERAGPLLADLSELLRTRVHLVAVRSAQPVCAHFFQQRLQLSGRSAIAIHDHQLFVSRPKLVQLFAQLVDDPGRIKVKQRGDAIDVDVPLAPVDDVLHLAAERAADDQRGGAHVTCSSWGNPSTEMKESLKSERPDSSTYSMRAGSSNATCRSRYDSSAIFAPSPAEFPTAMMRSTSTAGTRPMILALSGFRYEPNEPPSSTSSRSPALTPRMSIRTLIPVAMDPFANWSSRMSRWVR